MLQSSHCQQVDVEELKGLFCSFSQCVMIIKYSMTVSVYIIIMVENTLVCSFHCICCQFESDCLYISAAYSPFL